MKVMLVNGSPHENGCTYTALNEIKSVLTEEGVDAEIFWIGNKPISGCLGCGSCDGGKKCIIGDTVNEFLNKAEAADGFIFGSPVHYAAATGAITSFMDRAFFAGSRMENALAGKAGAAVFSARRGGTTAAFDQLNKYFGISEMPIISSCYWNMVHGNTPDEVRQDKEGLRIMRVLAHNMAFYLKCRQAGLEKGVPLPKKEPPAKTNFIR